MGNIDWLPISELPEAFKDGRELLLWMPASLPIISRWLRMGRRWRGLPMGVTPTHFAEINPPS